MDMENVIREKAAKFDELVKNIKSLGCQADISMLRIIGPSREDTKAYESAKAIIEKTWAANVSVFGPDLSSWPERERLLYEILSRDVDDYEIKYC